MVAERRSTSFKENLFKLAIAGLLTICTSFGGVIVFCGKGWLREWASGIAAQSAVINDQISDVKKQLADIKDDTKDLPTLKVQTGILWKEAGH